MQELTPMTDDQVQAVVASAIEDAVDYFEAHVAPERIRAMKYYKGEVSFPHETGRSKVVDTKCRDQVRAIKPALMRAFMAADKPVEFIPKSDEDVAGAEQATQYVQWKFNQINGYRVIYNAVHDALVQKTGVVKVYHEEKTEVEIDEYSGLSQEQMALIAQTPGVTVLEQSEEIGAAGPEFSAKVAYEKPAGDICVDSIAPEDFFANETATCIEDATVCGHKDDTTTVGDLVKMGFEFSEVIDYAGSESDATSDEANEQRKGVSDSEQNAGDPSMRRVLVTEAYIMMDKEGIGIPKLYQAICAGSGYHVLRCELADEKPFAIFEIDPEPHSFVGRSLVELVMPDQDASTSLLRGMIDNINLTNNPGVIAMQDQVNMEDLLNNEIGAIKRVKRMDAILPFTIPFTAGATLPALQYYDEKTEGKTGVSRASMGLDADALQNTTAAGVNAMTQAASGQNELMARNLAEGGMRRLFRLMMKLVRQHPDRATMMRLDNRFVEVDPRSWNADMDIVANVGLGTGGEVEREMALREILQQQTAIYQTYGPQNGLVTMTKIRNTMADIAKSAGIQNAERYYAAMDEETEMQMHEQAAQAAQQQSQGGDPNAAFMQVEGMKAQMRAQTEQQKLMLEGQKAMAEHQRKLQEMAASDDLARDKMVQDAILEAAKLLGQYSQPVNLGAIQAAQAAPR